MGTPKYKLSKFHSALSHMDMEFPNPKILLEQYPTDVQTTAELIHMIQSRYGDIKNKMVADLGCGLGVLSIGAGLLGADYVLGIDIDEEALEVCKDNIEIFDQETATIDLLQMDLMKDFETTSDNSENELTGSDVMHCGNLQKFQTMFDTVIMNPPFGTKKNEGIDMKFVQLALAMSNNSVYSFHKSARREFIQRKAIQWNVDVKVLGEVRFQIPQMYKFHKMKSVDIEVDFIRFSHR